MVKPDKSRYVYLYLSSADEKRRWEDKAKEVKAPLSRFVIEIVENAMADEEEFTPRGELAKEAGELRSENKKLRDELKLKNIVIEKYENELKRYRSATFLEEGFVGTRKYDNEIIAILKRGGVIDSYRLLEKLGIDPRETDLVKAVSLQLEDLEAYGLVVATHRGWRWNE